jgi:hypothetical protein
MGHDEAVYFMHIPKTAGTTVRRLLADVLGDEVVSPPLLWDALVGDAAPARDRWRVWCGHFGGVFPLWLGRWPFTFTFLREPIARSVSHINHVQREAGHPLHGMAQGLSVSEFCRSPQLRRTIENYQARHLASLCFSLDILRRHAKAPAGTLSLRLEDDLWCLDRGTDLRDSALRALEGLDFVGVCEATRVSLALLSRALGAPAPTEDCWLNTAGPEQRAPTGLAPEERQALLELTEIDRAVYGAAVRRFRAHCERSGMEPGPLAAAPA